MASSSNEIYIPLNSYNVPMRYLLEKRDKEWFQFRAGSKTEPHRIDIREDEELLGAINLNKKGTDVAAQLMRSQFLIGEYYPRIFRPIFPQDTGWELCDPHPKISLEEQLNIFSIECEKIFRVIQPDEKNFNTFGHEIGNLLILICTELESQFRGILNANGFHLIQGKEKRFNTNEFVNLLEPMRLSEFEIKIQNYPWLPSFTPFKDWDKDNPTTSLAWYDAYNSVKHDRWENLPKATITNLLEALTACAVIYHAQYGKFPPTYGRIKFRKTVHPKWAIEENYIPPTGPKNINNKNWKAIKFKA